MRLLLDTHVFYWWMTGEPGLGDHAIAAIKDRSNTTTVSLATLWEMAIKAGNGKWPEALPLVQNFERELAAEGFLLLPITAQHVRHAGLMSFAHKDPFDRLLAAQALEEGLTLVSVDPVFKRVARLTVL